MRSGQHHAATGGGERCTSSRSSASSRFKVQEAEIARRERELVATVLKPAEMERQRIETLANAEKMRLTVEAKVMPRPFAHRVKRSQHHPAERRSRGQGV
jgi:hypothetical protein